MILRVIGLLAALALCSGAYYAYDSYGQFANVRRWSGIDSLGWLRGWLTEFRMPLLCIAAFLTLTFLSWVWQKLKLGH
ncbi:MAG: hypothetical protein AAFV19_11415 [Pseudomonadota bacterium]